MGTRAPGILSSPGSGPSRWRWALRGGPTLRWAVASVVLALLPGLPGATAAPVGVPLPGPGPPARAGADPTPAPPRATGPSGAPPALPAPLYSPGQWYNVTGDSATPLPRLESAEAAWDPAEGEILLYGGDNYSTPSAATWAYSDGEWSELNASGLPGPLSGDSLAYDANASELLLFGGVASLATRSNSSTTFAYRDGRWSALDLAGAPPPVEGAEMTYDPALNGVVLFGGANLSSGGGANATNALWLFADGAWSRLASAGGPGPRWWTEIAYDPALGGLLLYGGANLSDGVSHALGDTWLFAQGLWSRLTPAASPPALSGGLLQYDPALGTAVLAGGLLANGSADPVSWEFNGSSWAPLPTSSAPSAHSEGFGAYDPDERALLLAGGSRSGSYTDLLSGSETLNVSFPDRADVGQALALNASAAGGAPPFDYRYTVVWGDEQNASGSSGDFTHSYSDPATYPVSVVAREASGASAAWNGTVAVRPGPSVRLLGASDTDVDLLLDLSASLSGGTGPLAVTWELGDGESASGSGIEYSYATPGRYAISVWANDSLGVAAVARTNITVSATPELLLPAGGFAADAGLPVALSAGVTGGTAPLDVLWAFPNGSLAVGEKLLHVFPLAGEEPLTVALTDGAGAQVSDTVDVAVAPTLSVAIGGSTEVPLGGTGTFSANITGGTGPYRYDWAFADGENATGTTVRHLFAGATGAELLTLEVTDALNATATATASVRVVLAPSSPSHAALGLEETLAALTAIVAVSAGALWAYRRRGAPPPPPPSPATPARPTRRALPPPPDVPR